MKNLVITGGTGGLGSAVATAFTGAPWSVAAVGRETLDVTDRVQITEFFKEREVDLLVCAAGITEDSPLHLTGEGSWDRVFAVNFQGAATCAGAVLPGMARKGRGHVIFISSHSAIHPPAGQAAYAASKAALRGLTAALAKEYGASGIRVNLIFPGFMETRMTTTVSPRRRAEVQSGHALGKFNTPEAVGKFVRFMHEELPFTSGQEFQLDSRVPW